MWLENHHWNFDYVRLAWDTGFLFEKYKISALDKSKIALVDIERIILERDVACVEKYMPSVIQYVLDDEQAEVLDHNFVKIFRLSQLSVEYLIFCKKYLDNTVTLLKEEIKNLKDENNELKLFNEELKHNVHQLMTRLKISSHENICTYRCEQCTKVFSTEEYLTAHIKRRHLKVANDISEADNDKLNLEMEIKEIKQKLNNTEKLIQDDKKPKLLELNTISDNVTKVNELQMKFESLKNQVECEFKLLQSQKDFEEKYAKWFHVALTNIKTSQSSITPDNNKTVNVQSEVQTVLCEKRNSITQTDSIPIIQKDAKYVQVEIQSPKIETPVHDITIDNRSDEVLVSEQFDKVTENLTNTVTCSLKKIESQMQSMWNKLSVLENMNLATEPIHIPIEEKSSNETEAVEEKKPLVKPRSPFTKKSRDSELKSNLELTSVKVETAEQKSPSKNAPEEHLLPIKSSKSVHITKTPNPMYRNDSSSEERYTDFEQDSDIDSKSEEKIDDEPIAKIVHVNKSETNTSTLGRRSITSLKKAALDPRLLAKFHVEVEDILHGRLGEIGLSSDWKGIPERTFIRSMEIVDHQAILVAKTLTEFTRLRKKLVRTINRRVKNHSSEKSKVAKEKKVKPRQMSLKQKNETRGSVGINDRTAQNIEIKNRHVFESDTESDEIKLATKPEVKRNSFVTENYNAVVEEMKIVNAKHEKVSLDSSDDDSMPERIFVKNKNDNGTKTDIPTKGVLRNFPSAAPVPKKRVLFDLKGDPHQTFTFVKSIPTKDGGSTTSVASSVLDVSHVGDSVMATRNEPVRELPSQFMEDFSDIESSEM